MKRALFLLVGLTALGAFAGCGGEDEPPNPLATRNGFCAEWAKRACTDDVVDACAARSAEACQEAQQAHCQELVSSDAYRQSGARACLDAVRTALSDGRLTAEDAGIVLRGEGPCSFQCVDVAGGGCVEPTEVGGGEECSGEDVVCAVGFYCDGSNCLARRNAGAECSAERPCKENLKCVGEEGAQVCQEREANGEECTEGDDCQSGICGTTGVCSPRIILAEAEPACALFR